MLGSVLAVCVLLLLPLWMGRIGPNPIYGYTTAFARSSRENWFAMNRFFARLFLPFFAVLAPSDIFLNEKQIIWILLPGVAALFVVVRLEEWRRKRKEKKKAKMAEKELQNQRA